MTNRQIWYDDGFRCEKEVGCRRDVNSTFCNGRNGRLLAQRVRSRDVEIARDCGRLWEVVGSGQMIVWVARGRGRSREIAGDDGGVMGVGMVRFVNVVGDTECAGM